MGIHQAFFVGASAGVVNPLSGGTASGGGANLVGYQFNADGTITNTSGAAAGSWYSPTTASIGSGYYVRFTVNSGSLNYNQATTWTALSSALYFARDTLGDAEVAVEISTSGTGTPVVTSGTYTISHS